MRLKELRTQLGISQLKLAIDLNLNQNSISRYESGEREADYSTLIALADYFDVSVDYLLGKAERLYTGDEDLLSAETLASLAGEENKKPADQKASGLRGTGYDLLNDENRAVIDALIEKLYRSQFGE